MIGKNLSINLKIITSFVVIGFVLAVGFYKIDEQNKIVVININEITKQSDQTKNSSTKASSVNLELSQQIEALSSSLNNSLTDIASSAKKVGDDAKSSSQANGLISKAINQILGASTEAVNMAKETKQSITEMAKNIGFYLLTKEDTDKELLRASILNAKQSAISLSSLPVIQNEEEAAELMVSLISDIDSISAKEQLLVAYASNRAANMPSVEYASSQLNPRNQTITSTLTAMIDEGGAAESDETNEEYARLLIEMRHYQVSAAGDVRAYLALRNGAIDSAMQLYATVLEGLNTVIELRDTDEDLVPMEFEDDFDKLIEDVQFINTTALIKLKEQHSAKSWRRDIHTVNTDINPLVLNLSDTINDLIDLQLDAISIQQANMENAISSTDTRIEDMIAATASQADLVSNSIASLKEASTEVNKKTKESSTSLADIQNKANQVSEASDKSKNAMVSVDTIVLAVMGATLFAIFVIIIFIKQAVSNPIKSSVQVLNNIANGDLSDDITVSSKDEVGQLMGAMLQIKQNLTSFNEELSVTVDKAKSGELTAEIKADDYNGYMAEQAELINYLVHTVKTTLDGINTSLSGLASGNLDVAMDETHYEGDFRTAALGVNNTLDNIGELVTGIQGVVELALQGDLSNRIESDGKQGFELDIASSINNLMEIQDSVFKDISHVISGLATKDLTRLIENDLEGEYASIRDNNNVAQNELSGTFSDIATAALKVAESSNKMNEGNAELAARSEQQASYLEETSSAMEEFTASIQTNATNAKNASQVSEKASTTTKEGSVAVQEVAETVSKVSEAFDEIGSIVGIIDDIAFQTNILALNAAVEAARAGDHGRGFAVVAQEVRNLAQRSAESAKTIKEVVDTRAKSVSAAVNMATNAGETMSGIEVSINEVNALIQEISIASSEQADGVAQVNDAISRLDEMTQQNSHLVDGNNIVAQSLDMQSKELKAQVMDFDFIGKDDIDEDSIENDYAPESEDGNGIFDTEEESGSFVDDNFDENPFNEDL